MVARRAGSVDELWCEGLHPAVHGDVVDVDAALGQQLPDIPVGQAITQIPAHRERDDLAREAVAGRRRRGRPRIDHPISLVAGRRPDQRNRPTAVAAGRCRRGRSRKPTAHAPALVGTAATSDSDSRGAVSASTDCGEDPTYRALPHPVPQPGRFTLNSAVSPSGFSPASRSTRSRISAAIGGRPGVFGYVQCAAINRRCHANSVAGVTSRHTAAHAAAAGRAQRTAPDPTKTTSDAPPTAQHRNLVTQHQNLGVLRALRTPQQDQPSEHPHHHHIDQPHRHDADPPRRAWAQRSDVLARHGRCRGSR